MWAMSFFIKNLWKIEFSQRKENLSSKGRSENYEQERWDWQKLFSSKAFLKV